MERDFNPEEMDKACIEAEKDLENLQADTVKSMADWFTKWYLRAGHKRLGRLLVRISKGGLS